MRQAGSLTPNQSPATSTGKAALKSLKYKMFSGPLLNKMQGRKKSIFHLKNKKKVLFPAETLWIIIAYLQMVK